MTNLRKFTLLIAIALLVQGCAASSITKVYKAPYSSIELELTKFLDINSITFDNEGGIRPEEIPYPKLHHFLANQGDYRDRSKDKKRYKPSYEIVDYSPGVRLVIKKFFYYNIGGSGSYGLLFSVDTVTARSIRVEVDYFDNALLFGFVPVTFSGNKEEEYIHELFFNEYERIQPLK